MEIIGRYISVKTKTKDDVFGECLYQITGPIVDRQTPQGVKKFIKVVMLGGTGPSARPGMVLWDELEGLEKNIQDGITHKLVGDAQAQAMQTHYANKVSGKPNGIVEF